MEMERTATSRDLEPLDLWLDAQPAGCARVLFTDDVRAATAVLTERGRTRGALIVSSFAGPLPLKELKLRVVEALADGARARWPSWYGRSFTYTGALDDELAAPAEIAAVVAAHGEVLHRWLEQAWARARGGARPLFADLHLGVQARQLGLAVDRANLRIVVAAHEAPETDAPLLALARAAEWLAAETGARVIGVLPAPLAGRDALDPISYQWSALRFAAAAESEGATPECAAVIVHPVMGRPHPLSRVEQRLAQALAQSDDLRPLFEFNQRIETARGAHAVVDLVWRAGRVIVEIDGWDTHGNRCAFAGDRHRDYELTVSGYLVVRLTNDEVLDDAAKAVDKIRDVVKFRRVEKGRA